MEFDKMQLPPCFITHAFDFVNPNLIVCMAMNAIYTFDLETGIYHLVKQFHVQAMCRMPGSKFAIGGPGIYLLNPISLRCDLLFQTDPDDYIEGMVATKQGNIFFSSLIDDAILYSNLQEDGTYKWPASICQGKLAGLQKEIHPVALAYHNDILYFSDFRNKAIVGLNCNKKYEVCLLVDELAKYDLYKMARLYMYRDRLLICSNLHKHVMQLIKQGESHTVKEAKMNMEDEIMWCANLAECHDHLYILDRDRQIIYQID